MKINCNLQVVLEATTQIKTIFNFTFLRSQSWHRPELYNYLQTKLRRRDGNSDRDHIVIRKRDHQATEERDSNKTATSDSCFESET